MKIKRANIDGHRSTMCSVASPLRRYAFVWLACCVFLLGVVNSALAQDANGVCRVATTGVNTNNGADWATPKNLTSALNFYGCTEIWVEQGVYFADAYPYSFTISFNAARDFVRVYGGFVGNEIIRNQRNAAAHLTVLSGDRAHDDINNDGNNIDENISDINKNTPNSQNVIRMLGSASFPITSATVLDGFTITGGDARPINGFGGGLNCVGVGAGNQCNPTLSHLVFAGNVAGQGGALYLNGGNSGNSSPQISHVMFSGNQAISNSQSFGGALFCNALTSGTSSPILTDVTFSHNSAGPGTGYAGALYSDAHESGTSNPSLTNVTFDSNNSSYQGGAMLSFGYGGTSSPNLLNVTFSNNSALLGGAMVNLGQTDPNLRPGTSQPTLDNVTFFNNHANSFGGAIYNWGANNGDVFVALTNVTFSGNSAGQTGGAMYSTAKLSGNADHTLSNVILWGNTAGTAGASIYIDDTNFATTTLFIDNSIVQNGDSGIAYETGATSTSFISGSMNFNGDPQLGPLTNNGGLTLTMAPSPAGFAVDNGTCAGAYTIDQRGVARPNGPACDIGSVEAMPDILFADGFE